jgi:hypothetical protein
MAAPRKSRLFRTSRSARAFQGRGLAQRSKTRRASASMGTLPGNNNALPQPARCRRGDSPCLNAAASRCTGLHRLRLRCETDCVSRMFFDKLLDAPQEVWRQRPRCVLEDARLLVGIEASKIDISPDAMRSQTNGCAKSDFSSLRSSHSIQR